MFDLSKFRARHIVKKTATAAVALVALGAVSLTGAQAAPITIPTGLNPGDTYRLAFVSGGFDFSNLPPGPIDFQTFVDIEANSQAELAALNTTWTPIVSEPGGVNASVLTNTIPSTVQGGSIGFPIFLLNDTKLVDTYDDLWDGTIDLPFNVHSDGSFTFFNRAVYTNTLADGTTLSFGDYISANIPVGFVNETDSGWTDNFRGHDPQIPYSIYVISGLLTVPSESVSIPAPGSLTLLALGLVGLGFARRRKAA